MERTEIRLTRQQAAAVRGIAARRKMSAAAIVREAVDLWLRAHGYGGDSDERWQRALRVIGAFGSGGSDVSQEHDREFAKTPAPH